MPVKFSEDPVPQTELKINPRRVVKHTTLQDRRKPRQGMFHGIDSHGHRETLATTGL